MRESRLVELSQELRTLQVHSQQRGRRALQTAMPRALLDDLPALSVHLDDFGHFGHRIAATAEKRDPQRAVPRARPVGERAIAPARRSSRSTLGK